MNEKFVLVQTENSNPSKRNAKGITNKRIAKFSFTTEGDEIEVTLTLKGSVEAMEARFGTWAFGLDPVAELNIVLTPSGQTQIEEMESKILDSKITPEKEENEIDETEETENELDNTLNDLNNISK